MKNFKSNNFTQKHSAGYLKALAIEFHNAIDNGDEELTMKLADNEDLDVNYTFNRRVPIFSAINNGMCKLFNKIVNHPKWDSTTEDDFGEPLLCSLIYLYNGDDSIVSMEEKANVKKMIISLLNNNKVDFNSKDINDETAILIACKYPNSIGIVEALLENGVDVNVLSDFDTNALEEAIRNENIEAIKLLGKYGKSMVRTKTKVLAEIHNINLSEFGF